MKRFEWIFLPAVLSIVNLLFIENALPDTDGPEFVLLYQFGGIAHPPGYPLYSFFLRAWNLVFDFLSPLSATVSLSVFVSFLTHIILWQTLSYFTTNKYLKFISIALFVTTMPFIRTFTAPEPFALHLLLTALFIYAQTLILKSTQERLGVFLLSLAMSLSFCNHHSMAFLLPIYFYLIYLATQKKSQWKAVSIDTALGIILGLAPLSYFWFAEMNSPVMWGDWSEFWPRLKTHVFRSEFGTFSLRSGEDNIYFWPLITFLKELFTELYFIPMVLTLYSLVLRRKKPHSERHIIDSKSYSLSLMSFFLCGFLFIALMALPQSNSAIVVLRRFYPMAFLTLLIPMLDGLAIWVKRHKMKPHIFSGIALVILTNNILISELHHSERTPQLSIPVLTSTLKNMEPNAVLIVDSDLFNWGAPYIQKIERTGDGITFIAAGLLGLPWYQNHVAKQLNLPPEIFRGPLISIAATLAGKFPTYINRGSLGNSLPFTYPTGPLIRVVNSDREIIPPKALFHKNLKIFKETFSKNLEMDGLVVSDWDHGLILSYQRTWESLTQALTEEDHKQESEHSQKIFEFLSSLTQSKS